MDNSMDTLGPNTNAPISLLSERCILIAGEDRGNVLPLLQSQDNKNSPRSSHAYRGYEFWKEPGYTLILSGIGTGCIEPLIWELTRPNIVRELILIGTAGKMPGSTVQVSRPYAITEAFLVGTGLDGEGLTEPLQPNWKLPANTSTATSVSTDFFYGFSPRILTGDYPFSAGRLRERYAYHLARGTQLVEMEVAQFYAFCRAFGGSNLKYLAIKGVSNELGDDEQQIAASQGVIQQCLKIANQLLGIHYATRSTGSGTPEIRRHI